MYESVPVRCFIHAGIMDHDEHAIFAQLQIQLAHVRAELDGALKRSQGIFGFVRRSAAMRYDSIRSSFVHPCIVFRQTRAANIVRLYPLPPAPALGRADMEQVTSAAHKRGLVRT